MTDGTTPPRLILRRLVAFAVDHLLVTALVIVMLAPFTGMGLRLPQPFFSYRTFDCTPVDTAPAWLEPVLRDVRQYSLRLCENRLFGLPNGFELRTIVPVDQDAEGAGRPPVFRTSRLLVTPVSADLTPVTVFDWGTFLAYLLLGFLSALFTRVGRATPGKALLGLRLTAVDGPDDLSGGGSGGGRRPRPFLRELVRVGPLALLPLLSGLRVPFTSLGMIVLTLLSALVAVVALWYYAWPFVHWTGQARHDRVAGTVVRRR